MGTSRNILYSTAKGADNSLVKAVDAQRGEKYQCLTCDSPLTLKKEQVKRPHFAHKSLTPNCTPETVLHYSFKTLLAKKIQDSLEKKVALPVAWDCDECGETHSGNLLKKATQVKLEYNLGQCKPDIALLDKDNKVRAVIEIVVTHLPEQKALNYYKENKIAVCLYVLKTDEDIDLLNDLMLKPTDVNFCLNPKCLQCGQYTKIDYLTIIEGVCWKCSKPMKVAAIDGYCYNRDPDDFSLAQIKLAQKEGVNLLLQYSHTLKKRYLANTCGKCKAFIGKHHLFIDYIANPEYRRHSYKAGYFCESCYKDYD